MYKNGKPLIIIFLLVSLIFSMCGSVWAQQKYTLEYKFKQNDRLQYKTEKMDSINSSMPNGQKMTREMTNYSIQSLTIEEKPSQTSFTASVTLDSTWSESNSENDFQGRDNQSGRRRARITMGEENQHFTFNKYGQSTTDKSIANPLILPLPENPISINDQWEFNITRERKGRFQGETKISGKCLLYDVQENEDKNLAVIIVNAEIEGQGKFYIKTQDREISGTNRSSGTRSSLVYFDMDQGRIDEIVTEEETESVTEGSAFSSNMIRTSKSTTKLVDK